MSSIKRLLRKRLGGFTTMISFSCRQVVESKKFNIKDLEEVEIH